MAEYWAACSVSIREKCLIHVQLNIHSQHKKVAIVGCWRAKHKYELDGL